MEDILSTVCNEEQCEIDFVVSHQQQTRKDRLGREHIMYSRTGPLAVVIRNGLFHHLTMEVRTLPYSSNEISASCFSY